MKADSKCANIKCAVEECKYNDGAQLCQASSIEVLSSGDRHVETSDGTACHTFESK